MQQRAEVQKNNELNLKLWNALDDISGFDAIKVVLDQGADPCYMIQSGSWMMWSAFSYTIYNIYHTCGEDLEHYCKLANAFIEKMAAPDLTQTFPVDNSDPRLQESYFALLVMRYLDYRSYSLAELTINRINESLGRASTRGVPSNF